MAAGKRCVGLAVTVLGLAALLVAFGKSYLLWMLLVLVALAVSAAVLVRIDARQMRLKAHLTPGSRVGKPVKLTLQAERKGRFLAAGYAVVDLETENRMFGTTQTRQLVLPLRDRENTFTAELNLDLCGETVLRCTGLRIWDQLGLFGAAGEPFPESRTVCYPQPVNLEVSLSRNTVGAAHTEGLMQNRRGSDRSEIFDIREYAPGDDLRSVHWKLSCKVDTLIVREPSDPSHYDVALLPNLGLEQAGHTATEAELNSAAAFTISLGEQLLRQGIPFCLLIPTKQGLQVCEARSSRELHRLLPQWLGLRVQSQSGVGLQCFLTEHLDQHFTRLVLVSAGKYTPDLTALGKRVGVTAVTTADDASAPAYTALGAACEAVVLPARQQRDDCFRIIC